MHRSLLAIILASSACVGGFVALVWAVKAQPSHLTLSSQLSQSHFRVGEPVDLAVTLTNTTRKPIFLGGGAFEISSYHLKVTRADGKKVALTTFGQQQLTPPSSVSWNPSISLRPGTRRQIVFPLRRLFDLGNGGAFTVSVGRTIENSVQTGPNSYQSQSLTLSAAPVHFTIRPTALFGVARPAPNKETLLLSLNRFSRSGQHPEIAALRLRGDGTLSPLLEPLALPPTNSMDMVVSSNGKTAYVAREGALQTYSVQKNGAFKLLGAPTALKKHTYNLALSRTKRLLVYSGWGVQDFAVQANGTLRSWPQPPVMLGDDLAWSHDGRVVYVANSGVYSWEVTPQGTLRAIQSRFILGDQPQELFVAPSDRWLLCKTFVGGMTKESLALAQLDGQGHLLTGAQLWQEGGERGLHALGFDPAGNFALASHNNELLVFRVQQGTLQLVSRLDAHLGANAPNIVWGRGNHMLYVVGRSGARAFRLQGNGRLLSVGTPQGIYSDPLAVASLDVPTSPETFGSPKIRGTAYLESQVCSPETSVWLNWSTSGPPPRLNIMRLTERWSRGKVSWEPDPVELLPGGTSSLASLPAKARVDLARLFDLSLDGIYVLNIVPSQGKRREMRFKIEDNAGYIDVYGSAPSTTERRTWRTDVMHPQSSTLNGSPTF